MIARLTPEHEAQLRAAGPRLFAGRDVPTPFSERGFEIGDGWFSIVLEAVTKIEAAVSEHPGADAECMQVKEKLGTMRLYVGWVGPSSIMGIVSDAEQKSKTVCESCGARGKRVTIGGWMKTLCAGCAKRASGTKG